MATFEERTLHPVSSTSDQHSITGNGEQARLLAASFETRDMGPRVRGLITSGVTDAAELMQAEVADLVNQQ